MNKRTMIAAMLLAAGVLSAMAQMRTDDEMLSIARKRLDTPNRAKRQMGNNENQTLATVAEDSQYKMFAGNGGYVIVARNEAFSPIIGYSNESDGLIEIPCCMQDCLDMINENLEVRARNGIKAKATGKDNATYEVVSPLLTTYWQQGSPYNLKCPADYTGKTSLTGCVATAMAMVVRYFKYPSSVSNKSVAYAYKTDSKGTASDSVHVTINSTYDWNNMRDTYPSSATTAEKNAVSQLMFDCGAAAGLNYGSSATGGSVTTAARRFYEVFGYAAVNHTSKDYYTDYEWRQLVYDQLMAGCPLMHSGTDSEFGGHAFVLDGIDAEGMVHVNWGWGKSSAGYFDMLALTPTTTTRSYNFKANGFIYGLKAAPQLGEGEEQEYQLVVGRGTGDYKNDSYNISIKNNRVILNTGGVFNWTPVHFKGYTGVRYESLDGGSNYDVRTKSPTGGTYVALDINSRVGKSYGGYDADHDQTPSGIKPGKYRVFFACFNDDKNNLKYRSPIRQRYEGAIYWELTVADDGTLTLSDKKVANSPETVIPTGIASIPTGREAVRDNKTYNLNGQRVNDSYKGIIIRNGRKIFRK